MPHSTRAQSDVPTREHQRLAQQRHGTHDWRKWGPYLSERQWGTVREDYSADGSAWSYFPHDHARSRAYRWGEDGLAGISDDRQLLCFSLALWNGKDSILKERLFGLTGPEGNHGEDVKELYYHLDATPTHSYLKYLYKYPQAEFPYSRLVEENRRRSKDEPEFELLDTGVFADDRYFDVFVEYAKASPQDTVIRITAHNRGPESALLHLIPQVFFRNTWSWSGQTMRPRITATDPSQLLMEHPELGEYRLFLEGSPQLLFCDNETNLARLYGVANTSPHPKDAFHDYLIAGRKLSVNPDQVGTKAGAHYELVIPPGGSRSILLRLSAAASNGHSPDAALLSAEKVLHERRVEADSFYAAIPAAADSADARHVQRQAFAGLIWSKQFYHFDVPQWLSGDPAQPKPPENRRSGRNHQWSHLNNADILSMPDKWEYPWYAAWDLAFHMIPFAHIDPDFAKDQLVLLTREWYMHPSGQLPAYEWALGDVNPPVHAWATWKVYQIDREQNGGRGDLAFLERIFHKLMLNFTWWVNRKDAEGRNVFQGGFLGLDNIGVFDRSARLPTGGHINQADGTAWMAMYALNLMRIALELAKRNPVYQDTATKFFEHFLHIAAAMTNIAGTGAELWCEQDQFFYDILCLPDGRTHKLRVRSMVGLIPLFDVEVLDPDLLAAVPEFTRRLEWFLNYRPDLASLVSRWQEPGMRDTHLLSLLRGHRMKALIRRMLDSNEFLSDFGVRALSRHHQAHPYVLPVNGSDYSVSYVPAESNSGLFGGNSNWRGPIWFPVNYLLVESLRRFHGYYGEDFKVEHPTGSGKHLTLAEIADDLASRLGRIFLKDSSGRRPALAYHATLHANDHFKDHIIFHEYFHGDTGRGVGASHQTGWTALIADLLARPARAPSAEPRRAALQTV